MNITKEKDISVRIIPGKWLVIGDAFTGANALSHKLNLGFNV